MAGHELAADQGVVGFAALVAHALPIRGVRDLRRVEQERCDADAMRGPLVLFAFGVRPHHEFAAGHGQHALGGRTHGGRRSEREPDHGERRRERERDRETHHATGPSSRKQRLAPWTWAAAAGAAGGLDVIL